MHVIEVVEIETEEVVKRMETNNERTAERIERALLMQSNPIEFYVRTSIE